MKRMHGLSSLVRMGLRVAFLLGLGLAGLAAPAGAGQPIRVAVTATMSGPAPAVVPAGDHPDHVVGLGQRSGEAEFSDGRKAIYSNVYVMDLYRGKSAVVWGYTKMTFPDGSWLYLKWDSTVVGSDENGPVSKGQGKIVKGDGAYKGIAGTAEFTTRNLKAPGVSQSRAVLTYTQP